MIGQKIPLKASGGELIEIDKGIVFKTRSVS